MTVTRGATGFCTVEKFVEAKVTERGKTHFSVYRLAL